MSKKQINLPVKSEFNTVALVVKIGLQIYG